MHLYSLCQTWLNLRYTLHQQTYDSSPETNTNSVCIRNKERDRTKRYSEKFTGGGGGKGGRDSGRGRGGDGEEWREGGAGRRRETKGG